MKLPLFVLSILASALVFSQEKQGQEIVNGFMKRFYAKLDTVEWLCRYDNIAWWTSDSVFATPKEEQAKLGAEWFCFEQDGRWHAVYGKYENSRFHTVYHYVVDSTAAIKRVSSAIDTAISNPFSRAIINSHRQQEQFPDSTQVPFNQYIKGNEDGTISVWLLPAFSTSGIAIYGGEFYYLFDRSGNQLIRKVEFSQGYKGFKPDSTKEIWLEYETTDEPSLGAVFFVWYYKRYFDRIVIDASKFKSTVFHDESKGYYWVHGVK